MKKKKTFQDEDLVLITTQARLVEGGAVFLRDAIFIQDIVPYDRLVFLLAKEWLYPVGGWQA